MGELYRRISVRMWVDEDFRGLSGPQANAQDLWIYLLTGPHTKAIPGLFAAHQEELAAKLKWDPKGFREALSELMPSGSPEASAKASAKQWLEADWEAGVVWVPNSFAHNEPQSPNVIRGWKNHWDLIPECDLKTKALQTLRGFCQKKGKAFGKAFDETFQKALQKASRKASGISGAGTGAGTGAGKEEARTLPGAPPPPPEQVEKTEPEGHAEMGAEPQAHEPQGERPEPTEPAAPEPGEPEAAYADRVSLRTLIRTRFDQRHQQATGDIATWTRANVEKLAVLETWLAPKGRCGRDYETVLARLLDGFFGSAKAEQASFPIAFLATSPREYWLPSSGAPANARARGFTPPAPAAAFTGRSAPIDELFGAPKPPKEVSSGGRR